MKRKLFISLLTLAGVLCMLVILSILMSSFINRKDDIALSKEKIAVVEIIGTIVSAEEVIEQIERYGEDSSIKAIVLRIDSPGGGVVPSQEIYNEVLKVRNKGKKVVVSMGSVAASGGYYIASASNKIIANPGTITGSIGVLMEFSSIEELMRKVGLKTEIIKSGKFKGLGAPTRSLTAQEKEVLKRVIDDVYEQFVNAVARGRNLPVEKVKRLADGRIYSGKQSIELGLVDGLGNLQDAISETAKMIGIKGKPRIVKEKIKDSWFYRLLNGELFRQYFSSPASQFNFKFQYIWLY